MKKKHISEYWNKANLGHYRYNFVDVVVNDDNLLFIDPILLELANDEWCRHASKIVQSFFDTFYEAYRTRNSQCKKVLLSHASEQNGTRLGYGHGDNGKGNTLTGLLDIFSPLEVLLEDIPNMKKAEDLTLMLPKFAEDGLSDLLTNVLHDQLNEFTLCQLARYGIKSNSAKSFWTWEPTTVSWKMVQRPSYCIEGKEFLAVPKQIVRKKYLYSTGQYFNRIILERMRTEGQFMDAGKPLSKKDIIKSKSYSGEHWKYDEVVSYTKKNNDALDEYHQKSPLFYWENGGAMTDQELDILLYGKVFAISA